MENADDKSLWTAWFKNLLTTYIWIQWMKQLLHLLTRHRAALGLGQRTAAKKQNFTEWTQPVLYTQQRVKVQSSSDYLVEEGSKGPLYSKMWRVLFRVQMKLLWWLITKLEHLTRSSYRSLSKNCRFLIRPQIWLLDLVPDTFCIFFIKESRIFKAHLLFLPLIVDIFNIF